MLASNACRASLAQRVTGVRRTATVRFSHLSVREHLDVGARGGEAQLGQVALEGAVHVGRLEEGRGGMGGGTRCKHAKQVQAHGRKALVRKAEMIDVTRGNRCLVPLLTLPLWIATAATLACAAAHTGPGGQPCPNRTCSRSRCVCSTYSRVFLGTASGISCVTNCDDGKRGEAGTSDRRADGSR